MNTALLVKRIILLLLLLPTSVYSTVPLLLNYQGEVLNSTGVPINGNGQFKFAIVNQPGDTLYWSNDTEISATGEPASSVTLPITDGRFSVLLGDTNLTNMNSLEPSVFEHTPVYLRVWFSEDGLNFEQFSPDIQFITTAFAFKAGVADQALSVDTKQFQRRVDKNCIGGESISVINEDGSVICEPAPIADWNTLQNIPADIVDGDNDTLYSAGNDIEIVNNVINLSSTHTQNTSVHHSRYTDSEAGTVANSLVASHAANSAAHHLAYTNADTLSVIDSVSGSGNGLDADMLDGIHASAFAKLADSQTFGNNTLRIDTINNRIGISQSAPQQSLDVAGDVIANGYQYQAAKTYSQYLHASTFTRARGTTEASWRHYDLYGGYGNPLNSAPAYLIKALNLPQGADITEVICYYYDADVSSDITQILFVLDSRAYTASNAFSIALAQTTAPIGDATVHSFNDPTVAGNGDPVDNDNYSYSLRVEFTHNATAASNDIRFYGCRLLYKLNSISSP